MGIKLLATMVSPALEKLRPHPHPSPRFERALCGNCTSKTPSPPIIFSREKPTLASSVGFYPTPDHTFNHHGIAVHQVGTCPVYSSLLEAPRVSATRSWVAWDISSRRTSSGVALGRC